MGIDGLALDGHITVRTKPSGSYEHVQYSHLTLDPGTLDPKVYTDAYTITAPMLPHTSPSSPLPPRCRGPDRQDIRSSPVLSPSLVQG